MHEFILGKEKPMRHQLQFIYTCIYLKKRLIILENEDDFI